MAYSSGYDCDLESHIFKMSSYLEEMVLDEENNPNTVPSTDKEAFGILDFKEQTPPLYMPPLETSNAHCSTIDSFKSPSADVASAFSTTENNSYSQFLNPPYPKARKMGSYNKQTEKEPKNTDIDINATMADLGLTPESLTSNEVYRLFSMYERLSFYIHADYIFEDIYEKNTLPSTLSASVQTKHAVWSSSWLLRQLRDSLKKHIQVTAECQGPMEECKQSLEKLQVSIMKLDAFKNCSLEHRRGKFVSAEASQNLQPLMNALTEVIENICNSRMYIQVIKWAIKKEKKEIESAAVSNCEEPAQPILKGESLEVSATNRPAVARRYIG